jgi:hypothetical protein
MSLRSHNVTSASARPAATNSRASRMSSGLELENSGVGETAADYIE